MPTYEYRCNACKREFEYQQKMSDDDLVKCEACGEDKLEKLISWSAFQLKGSGWYKDLYSSNPKAALADKVDKGAAPKSDKAASGGESTASSGGSDSGSSSSSSDSGSGSSGSGSSGTGSSGSGSSGSGSSGGASGGGTGGSTAAAPARS
jgi:putative FmdB family regulatory protein